MTDARLIEWNATLDGFEMLSLEYEEERECYYKNTPMRHLITHDTNRIRRGGRWLARARA